MTTTDAARRPEHHLDRQERALFLISAVVTVRAGPLRLFKLRRHHGLNATRHELHKSREPSEGRSIQYAVANALLIDPAITALKQFHLPAPPKAPRRPKNMRPFFIEW